MTSLKEKYEAAVEAKNNDITTYVWKGPKEDVCGHKIQRETRLIDATEEELKNFYKHCGSMLYSTNPINPGRYTLIKQIQEDRDKCNTELYLRYLENSYHIDDSRPRCPRDVFRENLRIWLSTDSTGISAKSHYDIPITAISDDIPAEFQRLNVGMVKDGCIGALGEVHKKPITLNFILSLGVWFTPDEMVDLTEKDPSGKTRNRKDVVIERLQLKNNVRLKIDPKGLTYGELRAMLRLRKCRFSELTTEQLVTLKNKVLFMLEEEALKHIEFWLEKSAQIEKVCEYRGIDLREVK